MKREREGGGNSPGRGGVGGPLRPGQSIPDARLRSQRRRPAKVQRQLADKVTPLARLTLEVRRYTRLSPRVTFILRIVTYCAAPGPVYRLSANIEQGAVIT